MQLNIGKLAPSIPRTWTRRAWWHAEPPCSSLPCVKGMSVEGRMLRPPAHKSAPHLLCRIGGHTAGARLMYEVEERRIAIDYNSTL